MISALLGSHCRENLVRVECGNRNHFIEAPVAPDLENSLFDHFEELFVRETRRRKPALGHGPEVQVDVVPDVLSAHGVEPLDDTDITETSFLKEWIDEVALEPRSSRRPERLDSEAVPLRKPRQPPHDLLIEGVSEFGHNLVFPDAPAPVVRELEFPEVAVRRPEVDCEHAASHEYFAKSRDSLGDFTRLLVWVEEVNHLDTENSVNLFGNQLVEIFSVSFEHRHPRLSEEAVAADREHLFCLVDREDRARRSMGCEFIGRDPDPAPNVHNALVREVPPARHGLMSDQLCHRRVVVGVAPVEKIVHGVPLCLHCGSEHRRRSDFLCLHACLLVFGCLKSIIS